MELELDAPILTRMYEQYVEECIAVGKTPMSMSEYAAEVA